MSYILVFFSSVFILLGVYERGRRKGMEAAEKLYEPLMKKVMEMLEERENV